ncbi:addiction module protein [Roseiconus lacunae]|uniref:addiction module protein n=1 Tax=Roseiconus lacunae TaxID=2605694 RepID=UPI003F533E19
MSLESILSSLTPNEKLAAMNILWRDLSANATDFQSPDWHGEVLDNRIANPSAKPRLQLNDAFNDVRERLDARRTEG